MEGDIAKTRERERERNSISKTSVLKDNSVRSIWTYLTASPCYTTNINMYDYTTNTERGTDRQRQTEKGLYFLLLERETF